MRFTRTSICYPPKLDLIVSERLNDIPDFFRERSVEFIICKRVFAKTNSEIYIFNENIWSIILSKIELASGCMNNKKKNITWNG